MLNEIWIKHYFYKHLDKIIVAFLSALISSITGGYIGWHFTYKQMAVNQSLILHQTYLSEQRQLNAVFVKKIYKLKNDAIRYIAEPMKEKKQFDAAYCQQLRKQSGIDNTIDDLINSTPNLGELFGKPIMLEAIHYREWFSDNLNTCFFNVKNPSKEINEPVHVIQGHMMKKMYPQEPILGIL